MDYYLIFGMVAVAMIAMIGLMSNIKKSVAEEKQPIQELNITITRLNANFEHMLENDMIRDRRIGEHGKEIDENQRQIQNLEKVTDLHELRIGALEDRAKRCKYSN